MKHVLIGLASLGIGFLLGHIGFGITTKEFWLFMLLQFIIIAAAARK